MNSTVATLETAKTILLDGGWIKGELENASGCCLLGAVGIASSSVLDNDEDRVVLSDPYVEATNKLNEVLWSRKMGCSISGFNDAVYTELEDILKLIDDAIARV